MNKQTADKITMGASEFGVFRDSPEWLRYLDFINSFVSEDEEIDELLESIDARPKCTRCGYLVYTDTEIAKRLWDEYNNTVEREYYEDYSDGVCVVQPNAPVITWPDWLEKED